MPAISQSQQKLMGQAYALKKGDLKPEDLNPEYRKQIEDLANGMTLKQLKDYAETSHEDLPKKVKESKNIPSYNEFIEENSVSATVSSVNGIGAPAMPGNPGNQQSFTSQKTGSGDIPFALSKGQPRKKKKSSFVKFKDFIKGSEDLRSAF
jgi:hypothetical protein